MAAPNLRPAPRPDPSVVAPPARRPRPVGLLWMAGGALGFSLMSLLVKIAGERIPTMEVVWVRAVVTLVLSLALVRHARVSALGTDRRRLVARGLLGFGALSAFYWSVVHLPLAEATVLQYTNPLFAALLAVLVLRERMRLPDILALLLGFAGVVLVARPTGAGGIPPLALAIALTAAVLSASAYVMVRRLRGTEHPDVIVLWFAAVSVVGATPFALGNWVWPTPAEWLVLLGVGVTTQVGQVCITRGLHLETAGRATAIGYTQVLFATLWGLLFLGEVPGALVLVGGALVLVGSVLLAVTRAPPAAPAPAKGE